MWWRLALKAALMLGLDKWAERKAVELAAKLKAKAAKKADTILATVGQKVEGPGTIIIRRDRDDLRPGSVQVVNDVSYRVTQLLVVNRLGAFYGAKAE